MIYWIFLIFLSECGTYSWDGSHLWGVFQLKGSNQFLYKANDWHWLWTTLSNTVYCGFVRWIILCGSILRIQSKYKSVWQFVINLLQPITWQLMRSSTCIFSHMTYLMSHVTCLNNICGWFYKLSYSEL